MSIDKKVLIIDDDSRNIFAMKAYLQAKKIMCLSATGAKEGLRIMDTDDSVGVVLIDIMMPDMDGYQAIAQMRQQEKFKSLPVIAVTAQAMVGDREKSINAGATDYISKPVDVDKLLLLLKHYLIKEH